MSAWLASAPANDSLLINAPAAIRANWDAIALGTAADLLITNAKVSASAAIEESKILFSATGHTHAGTVNGKKISLTTAVSGVLPVINGGTGVDGDTYDADKLDGQHGSYYIEFRSGDMMISSLTTAPSGWTDVSATYNNKFIRISSGTPLTAGGADTVTLSVANLAPHTHSAGSLSAESNGAHTHTAAVILEGQSGTQYAYASYEGGTLNNTGSGGAHTHTISGTSESAGSGTAFSIVPAYILTRLFKKD